jgi:hypothetical protein
VYRYHGSLSFRFGFYGRTGGKSRKMRAHTPEEEGNGDIEWRDVCMWPL